MITIQSYDHIKDTRIEANKHIILNNTEAQYKIYLYLQMFGIIQRAVGLLWNNVLA